MTHRDRRWLLVVSAGLAVALAGCRHASETGGASTAAPVREPATPAPSFPREPSVEEPVVAVGTLDPARVEPGGTATLVIHVRTAATWHIYAHDATGTPNTPTELTLALPPGVEAVEEWQHPPAHSEPGTGGRVLEGSFVFQRKLRVQPAAARGSREIVCEMSYQACDPLMCRPPERLTVRIPMEVAR
jgi:hypothetical protein